MKKLNSHKTVMMKNMKPIAPMATRFLPVRNHSNGDFIASYWPGFVKENRVILEEVEIPRKNVTKSK